MPPYSIAVFEDKIYWTSQKGIVSSIDKFSQHVVKTVINHDLLPPTAGIAVMHLVMYIDAAVQENPCQDNGCSDICVPSFSNSKGYKCLCGYDRILQKDNATCLENPVMPRIYLGVRQKILKFPLVGVGSRNHMIKIIQSESVLNPTSIDVPSRPGILVYLDANRNRIIKLYTDNSKRPEVLYKGLVSVRDLAVDVVSGNLYWVDSVKCTIEVGSVQGTIPKILVDDRDQISRPNSITLDIQNRHFYFSDIGSSPFIGKCALSGESCLPLSLKVIHPNDLVVYRERLYIADSGMHRIISLPVAGSGRKIVHWHHHSREPYSIAMYKDAIYWTELGIHDLYSVAIDNSEDVKTVLRDVDALQTICIYDPSVVNQSFTDVANPCALKNGNCSHFCFATTKSYVCSCSDGYTLQNDSYSCIATSHVDDSSSMCTGFRCKDGPCIPHPLKCNNVPDCPDHSDEDGNACASQKTWPQSTGRGCEHSEYLCDSGECVPYHQVCDNTSQCLDSSDEGVLCAGACRPGECEQECYLTPKGSICRCQGGYVLQQDGVHCRDADECDTANGGCSQKCENTVGGFHCHCIDGFTSSDNGTTCSTQGPAVYLILLSMMKISKVTNGGQAVDLDLSHKDITSMDVITQSGNIIFSTLDFQQSEVSIYSVKKNRSTVRLSGLGLVKDMAYDWLTHNLYIVDDTRQCLQVCSLSGASRQCKTLFHEEITSLAINPLKRKMFWGSSLSKEIDSSWMTGEGRHFLVSVSVPSCLVVDAPAERLYWVNSMEGIVESSRLDGMDRQVILREHMQNILSVDVLGSTIYMADASRNKVYHYTKQGRLDGVLIENLEMPSVVKVVHPLRYPKVSSPCATMGCSHLCLLGPRGGHCECPDGLHLFQNSSTQCAGPSVPLRKETSTYLPLPTTHGSLSKCNLLCLNGGSCIVQKKSEIDVCRCRTGYSGRHCHVATFPASVSDSDVTIILGCISGLFITVASLIIICLYFRHKRSRANSFLVQFQHLRKKSDSNQDLVIEDAIVRNPEYLEQKEENNNIPLSRNHSLTSIDSAFLSHPDIHTEYVIDSP